MLEINHLCAGYGGTEVLHGIDFSAPAGKITAIVGPNGCGKSTLLKAISGINPAADGQIRFHDLELGQLPPNQLARQVAYLPQNRQVPEITARRLVLHGRFPYLSYPRRYRKVDFEIADRAMADLDIRDLADREMNTLSGGQRQKVYLAMVLAQDTPVVLMDEPTTFLDISHQMQLMEQARYLAGQGKTVVMVLHDLSMAMQRADHLVVMADGRVLCQGESERVFASGCLEEAFGVRVERVQTPDGWQYYYGGRQ